MSVVVPCYNYGRFLGEAVRSILAQTCRDFEIIVVDDGSTDDTAAVAAAFGPAVRYVHQPNRGPSGARNTGIRHARGRHVAFLDADDLWMPDKLERQVPILDARPEVGLVYADTIAFDDQTGRDLGRHSATRPHREGRILAALLVETNFIPSQTPVVRRSVLDQVGPFDESLRAAEDWDLWIRIAARCEVARVPVPLARCRQHGANVSGDLDLMRAAMLTVVDRALADPAVAAAGVDERLARRNALVHIGLCHLTAGHHAAARAELLAAVRADPRALLDRRVTPRIAASIVGRRGLAVARSLRALGRLRLLAGL